jgi:hypothetical protein
MTRSAPGIGVTIAAAALLLPAVALADGWPAPAERSGPEVPPQRGIEATAVVQGAYVPASVGVAPVATGTFGGALTWCFAPLARLGLFGRHEVYGLKWGNVALLALGHEIGLRYVAARHLTVETAFLTHRVDRAWVDDFETRPGGVSDVGGELGAWLPFAPHSRVRLDAHLLVRLFDVYRDTQGALGGGARATLRIARGHSVALELTVIRAQRSRPRAGVDHTTWNAIGDVSWRFALGGRLGGLIGARLSTSMLVGVQPMLELKRSMIDEPMALAYVGLFFGG